jgi:hypothetical protein
MMKNLLILFLLVAGFACFGCASSQQDIRPNNLTDEQIAAYNSDPKNTDKIVCTKESHVGTLIPKRVCRKESEIAQRARADQQTVEKIQSGVITGRPKGN